MVKKLAIIALLVLVGATAASAQMPKLETLIPGTDGTAAGRIVQLILVITVLSVAPGLLMMVTCFTRFVVALSFLRAGLGLQTTPANLILISLALFMTFYVMGPTFDQGLAERRAAADGEQDQRAGGLHAHQRAVQDVHARQRAGKGPEAVRGPGAGVRQKAQRRRCPASAPVQAGPQATAATSSCACSSRHS